MGVRQALQIEIIEWVERVNRIVRRDERVY